MYSLWPSVAIWRQRSGPTLDQVMACCLPAPSSYLKQYWLVISEILLHSPESHLQRVPKPIFFIKSLKVVRLKSLPHPPGPNENRSLWAQLVLDILHIPNNIHTVCIYCALLWFCICRIHWHLNYLINYECSGYTGPYDLLRIQIITRT